ncbi:MAG: DEAD/DEAH box helicase [Muribaculaceae bacterium]|nr:DEAD/DEAH box helicase [Muribaculaceae bacterium]
MKEKEIRALLQEKEGIETLNPMQERMLQAGSEKRDIILLSPTGSGKTVAFAVPLLKMMKNPTGQVQAVVIAPSRELVVQIAGVIRNIGGEFRVLALYGGHKVEDEVNSLKVTPDIIVATPGRLLDHAVRRNIDLLPTRILVLDEFDKSLELGFEEEMQKIVKRMKNLSRIILTSATDSATLPEFLPIKNPVILNFLEENKSLRKRMRIYRVDSDDRDKLKSLLTLLKNIGIKDRSNPERSIIFVNHRESAERIYDFLRKQGVSCVLYHGALDQQKRESAIASFNSGVRPILVATDLAARGLDIEGVQNVVHYHLPMTQESYTHRNGRTARVAREGDVYLLVGPEEKIADYIQPDSNFRLSDEVSGDLATGMDLLYVTGGKREKLSKGDLLGWLVKEAGVSASDIGKLFVFDHYSLIAVKSSEVKKIIETAGRKKIKGEKRRISIMG